MFNADDFKLPPNPVVIPLYEYVVGKLGIVFQDGALEKLPLRVGDVSMYYSNKYIKDSLYEYDTGKLGVLYYNGNIEPLELNVGDSSPFVFKDIKWYETYEDGKLRLGYELWEILGYECSSDYYEDERNESSTGWLLDYAKNKMPERWHSYLNLKIRCR